VAAGQLDDSAFVDGQLGAEIDRPELFEFIGVVMGRVIERFSEVARDLGLS
jgi:hypothetical protein